jgi:hypothetical protein
MKTLIPVLSYLSLYFVFLMFCTAVGIAVVAALARWLDRTPAEMPNLSTAIFIYAGSGMGLVISALFLLALMGLLQPWAIALTAALGLAVAAWGLIATRGTLWPVLGLDASDKGGRIWGVLLLIYGAGLLLGALRAPFAWDELSYHLPYARDYVDAGGLTLNRFLRYPLHSHNFNLLFSLALMISDERLAHLIHGGSALLIALGLFGTARRFLGLGAAVLAVSVLFSFNGLRQIIPTAHVDLGLTFFVTLAAFSLLNWHATERRSWLFIAAIAMGMAMGTKYIGALFAPLFGLWVLARSRSLRETLLFTLLVTLFGIWWYLRSYLISGNPLHPFAGDLFGYFLWDAQDLINQHEQLASLSPATGLLAPVHAAVDLAFGEYRELSILALPFFLVPLAFKQLIGGLRVLFAVALVYYLIWVWVLGPSRYLMSILPVVALLSAAVMAIAAEMIAGLPRIRPLIRRLDHQRHRLLSLLAIALLVLVGRETLNSASRLFSWPWTEAEQVEYLTLRLPGYDLIRAANESGEINGRPLYLVGFGNLIYWYEGEVIGDHFGIARYRPITTIDPVSGQSAPDPIRMLEMAGRFRLHAVLVESTVFPRLDPQSWSRHFRLLAQTELGTLWLIGERGQE